MSAPSLEGEIPTVNEHFINSPALHVIQTTYLFSQNSIAVNLYLCMLQGIPSEGFPIKIALLLFNVRYYGTATHKRQIKNG